MSRPTEITGAPERRQLYASEFELREDGDTLTLTGYASVFDHPYDIWGGPTKGGYSEIVDRRAFEKTLGSSPDLHLLINHEGMPLARTKSGTLRLSTDKTGLKVVADLDRRDPDVQRLETKMRRGDMDEMSFAFRVVRQEWNDEETERRLTEVSLDKGDVSIVNFGANPATSAQLNSLQDALELLAGVDLEDERVLTEVRDPHAADSLRTASQKAQGLVRALTPPGKRTMTVAEALAAQEA